MTLVKPKQSANPSSGNLQGDSHTVDIAELRGELRDLEYAQGYAEAFLNSHVATQIKVLREQRGMKQSDLAREMETTQTAISRAENVNYSSWNTRTLKKFAKAFKLRLHVSFETFGTVIDGMSIFNREALQRPSHADDPILFPVLGNVPLESERERPQSAPAKNYGLQVVPDQSHRKRARASRRGMARCLEVEQEVASRRTANA
jgi:transcriptional regulator with XRE-family HTH domain